MSEYTSEKMEIVPYFDMELIMSLSQETRIGGGVLDRIAALWEAWIPHLQARRLDFGSAQYLAIWLDADIEEAIDKSWAATPSDAFMDNVLGQAMCMSAIHGLIPEIEDAGCAPAPKMTEKLQQALIAEGLEFTDSDSIARRYAVVTHFPFKGGCEICWLLDNCPKGRGQHSGPASIELPGYTQDQ